MRLSILSCATLILLSVGCASGNGGGAAPDSARAGSGQGGGGDSGAVMNPPSDGGGGGSAALAGAGAGGSASGAAGTALGGMPASGGSGGGAALGGAASGGAAGSTGVSGSAGSAGVSSYEPLKSSKYDEMPLFDGDPPNFKAGAPAETVNAQGMIGNVSVPTLRRYPMDASKATGFAYIVFPGGAYTGLDMETHATRLAERVGPLGIAVFGLKYRVGDGSNDAVRDALLDAKRAVRLVRSNAARWGVVAPHVGVVGYSAGSHLALNLAGNFDAGNANATDPIEKLSSRPAFVGSMSTWAFYKPESPFTFPSDVPPTYFCHAEDDTTAPIALARTVEGQIRAKGAATKLDIYATGGHSTCHPGDMSMPGHDWPTKFWPWLQMVVP